jgi:protocatechuate 3,4-dioxygenase beta subunit
MARRHFQVVSWKYGNVMSIKFYDNTTDEFRYRGSQRVGKNGKYQFTTIHPIPYPIDAAGTLYRPAHIHMRISGEGQQDLNHADIFSKMIHHLERDTLV